MRSTALVLTFVFALWQVRALAESDPQKIPFDDAKIIIEFNSTDEGVGIQLFLDGEPWRSLTVISPNGQRLLQITGKSKLRNLGITELFFESEEPSLEDLPLPEFLELFPEGEYQLTGTTVEGDELTGTAIFTHKIPDGPSIASPERNQVFDIRRDVIRWDPVTTPAGIQIAGYQVIVEGDNPLRVFSVDLPASETSVRVPRNFFEAGKRYKVEVLAKEVGGNQTISERSFRAE